MMHKPEPSTLGPHCLLLLLVHLGHRVTEEVYTEEVYTVSRTVQLMYMAQLSVANTDHMPRGPGHMVL